MCKLLFEKDAHQIKAFAFAQILHSTPFRSRMTAQRVLAQTKSPNWNLTIYPRITRTKAHRKISFPYYGSNAVAFAASFGSFLGGPRKEHSSPRQEKNSPRTKVRARGTGSGVFLFAGEEKAEEHDGGEYDGGEDAELHITAERVADEADEGGTRGASEVARKSKEREHRGSARS